MDREIELDDWQKKFLATKGDKILCTGRQVGKSVTCARDCAQWVRKNLNQNVLMIAPTERQAYALYIKTFEYINAKFPKWIVQKGRNKPTKTKFALKNGTKVYCLPTGLTGAGIRFLTIGRLYADEAARIPQDVWAAVTPMLLTTGGDQIYLSTPFGKEGRFYEVWDNVGGVYNSFTRFSITSKECIEQRPISDSWTEKQREKALEMIEQEKSRMTKLQFAQEYEGKFLDELRQFFPTTLIKECMRINKNECPVKGKSPFTAYQLLYDVRTGAGINALGVDVARMGQDDTAMIGLNLQNGKLRQFEERLIEEARITDTARLIQALNVDVKYKKLFIDDGGLGAGVVDILLETPIRRKVVAINNASVVYDASRKEKRVMKENLYNNLLKLMEQKKISLFKSNRLYESLKGIQAEYSNGKMKIFGKDSHLAEALVRAAWIYKTKGLNIWIA